MIDKANVGFYDEDESQRNQADDGRLFGEPKGAPS